MKIIKSTGFVCYRVYGKEAGENHEVIYIFLNKLANKVTSSTALIIFIILLLSKCHGKQASLKKHTHLFVFFALYVVLINNMCILSKYAHIQMLLWGFYICYKRIYLYLHRECMNVYILYCLYIT